MSEWTKATKAGATERGFTMLETVIALFLAMVMGFGAISLFLYSVNYNAGASDRARALALAQRTMETLRARDYLELANSDSTVVVTDYAAAAGTTDRRTFTVRTAIGDYPLVGASRQKAIVVTVTPTNNKRWTGGGVTLRTFRASTEMGSN
ncbi:MAG TPA: hypothetical protein VD968_01230 [Pyrinomonadaceae bacterium]|nr:hypothetical protein [Pyrinomonadaceae bacterium]